MTGKWHKNKTKKQVETSLGKAPKDAEKGPDLSHLRKPISTSVFGLKQVLSLFQTATSEVQEYITYECDVLYECRMCRTIYRSLANFILHKRNYCHEKYIPGGDSSEGGGFVVNDEVKASDEDSRCPTPIEKPGDDASTSESALDGSKSPKKTLLPIIDKLLKKQKIRILAKNTLNEDLSSKAENSDDDVVFVSEESNVVLQKIDTSEVAMFQTSVQGPPDDTPGFMKSEVMEIHGIFENNEVVLGTNGKVCTFETNKAISKPNIPKQDLVCTECNFTFSTEKTLTHHIKYKHNKTCTVFPCPDCKETFSNAWSVYRHLYKVHRRTSSQVRRMRALVHSSGIRKDQEPEKKKRKLAEVDENEENEWMNNFEGDKDLQMCGGCGKRFERKAALHSHSQMCTKRIAVCNTIKNKGKAETKPKEKVEKVKELKGAAKRKPSAVTIHKVTVDNMCKEESDEKIEENDPLMIKSEDSDAKPATVRPFVSDITITKDAESRPEETKILPEIEIFTISDDSNEGENEGKKSPKSDSCELHPKSMDVPEEYKEYLNDEADHCFLVKALSYIDKNELKCIPCETAYLSVYRLLRHMSLHFSWFRFQCSKCSYMSFNKYDCTTHAYDHHSTPNNLMESTVLPIPKWKVLCASHDFTELTAVDSSSSDDNQVDSNNQVMPRLEAIQEESVSENGVQNEETILVEDDEMPDICTESVPFPDTVILSDDDHTNNKFKAGPSKINNRPIRNRTKSVKTVQNDFIYDLAKVLKLNDNSIKSKVKRSFK